MSRSNCYVLSTSAFNILTLNLHLFMLKRRGICKTCPAKEILTITWKTSHVNLPQVFFLRLSAGSWTFLVPQIESDHRNFKSFVFTSGLYHCTFKDEQQLWVMKSDAKPQMRLSETYLQRFSLLYWTWWYVSSCSAMQRKV